MSGPLQRIGQATGQFIRRLGPPPQPVYRERVGKRQNKHPQDLSIDHLQQNSGG